MNRSITAEIARLRSMTVSELREKWLELYGEPTRSKNRDYLWRRLAWRIQELQCGGLSDRAKARLEELAPDSFVRARTPNVVARAANVAAPREPKVVGIRDPRRPTPGTILTREWHGKQVRVLVVENGFEWEGRRFGSLSEVSRAITGQRWSGPLFFGLRKRTRRS
jgi:hypothetical protein